MIDSRKNRPSARGCRSDNPARRAGPADLAGLAGKVARRPAPRARVAELPRKGRVAAPPQQPAFLGGHAKTIFTVIVQACSGIAR